MVRDRRALPAGAVVNVLEGCDIGKVRAPGIRVRHGHGLHLGAARSHLVSGSGVDLRDGDLGSYRNPVRYELALDPRAVKGHGHRVAVYYVVMEYGFHGEDEGGRAACAEAQQFLVDAQVGEAPPIANFGSSSSS